MRDTILSGLLEANENFAVGAEHRMSVRPSIRLLKPGTFADFRSWKGEMAGVGSSQVKVPVIMRDPNAQALVLCKVVGEVE